MAKNPILSVRVPAPLKRALQAEAQEEGTSTAFIVNRVLRDYCQQGQGPRE